MDRRSKGDLFESWYKDYGAVYQFIYRCNFSITDIQYRELAELLRMHCLSRDMGKKVFLATRQQMEEFLWEFQGELFSGKNSGFSQEIRKVCLKKIAHTIVIDNYYTSSIVYIPETITADIEAIVYEGGYIYSCGEYVFRGKIDGTCYAEVEEAWTRYTRNKNLNFRLEIYDSRKYSAADKGYEDDFKNNGISSLQLDPEHFYLQEMSLMEAMKRLNDRNMYQNSKETAWIFRDRAISEKEREVEQGYYFITWPLVLNKNVSYLFDTDHPAWNNTLIPHTFVSAMLNIGRGTCKGRDIKVLDPMVGSGTMAVEAAKYPEMIFSGSDIASDSCEMVNYNMQFFAMDDLSGEQLAQIIWKLLKVMYTDETEKLFNIISDQQKERLRKLNSSIDVSREKIISDITYSVKNFLDKNIDIFLEDASEYDEQRRKALKSAELSKEKVFYVDFFVFVFRKASLRHCRTDISRMNRETLKKAAFREITGLLFRSLDMLDILKQMDSNCLSRKDGKVIFKMNGINCVGVDYGRVYKNHAIQRIQSGEDLRISLKKYQTEQVDLIITDPPYGYNTEEQDEALYELYRDLAEESVKVVKPGGTIIMCLAARMHQGKRLPGFIKRDFVLGMFREAAARNGREIIDSDEEIRGMGELYDFPFFWESKKVLRREILKLQFR